MFGKTRKWGLPESLLLDRSGIDSLVLAGCIYWRLQNVPITSPFLKMF